MTGIISVGCMSRTHHRMSPSAKFSPRSKTTGLLLSWFRDGSSRKMRERFLPDPGPIFAQKNRNVCDEVERFLFKRRDNHVLITTDVSYAAREDS
jgi:hypothetical protein